MFDLSVGKLLVVALVALFLIGPERLPHYAAQLGKWVRVGRRMLDEAKGRVADELGPEFKDTDWQALDPRKYHPRRMIQDAWNATEPADPAERVAELERVGVARSSPEPPR